MSKKAGRFIVLAFSISWILWGILGLLSNYNVTKFGKPLYWTFFILGGSGPFIAAFIVSLLGDKEEHKEFIKQILKVKVSPLWYLWVIIIPFILFSIPWIIFYISKGYAVELFRQEIYMLFVLLPLNVIGGGTEEIGWRGVLLPELLNKFSKISSTLIVSVIWAIWHFPLWLIKGTPQENLDILFFVILSLCFSLILTILYTRTKSIFLCILLHSLINTYSGMLNLPILNLYRDALIMLAFCISIFLINEKNNLKISLSKSHDL